MTNATDWFEEIKSVAQEKGYETTGNSISNTAFKHPNKHNVDFQITSGDMKILEINLGIRKMVRNADRNKLKEEYGRAVFSIKNLSDTCKFLSIIELMDDIRAKRD